MKSKAAWAVCLVVAGTALYGTKVLATPATVPGFSGATLAKATYGEIFSHVHTIPASWQELIQTKGSSDLYVQQNTWDPATCQNKCVPSTGWHTHPGPSFVIVTQGTVTAYDGDDPSLHAARVHGEHRQQRVHRSRRRTRPHHPRRERRHRQDDRGAAHPRRCRQAPRRARPRQLPVLTDHPPKTRCDRRTRGERPYPRCRRPRRSPRPPAAPCRASRPRPARHPSQAPFEPSPPPGRGHPTVRPRRSDTASARR